MFALYQESSRYRLSVKVVFLLWFVHILAGQSLAVNMTKSETALHKMLFENYIPDVIPVNNRSNPIVISVDLFMMSLDNIDEKRQTFTVRAFLELKWKDEFLVWKPEEYSGVTDINVQTSSIWIPDIALKSTFDKPTDLGQDGGRANIGNNGNVVIWPYKVFTISCKIFIRIFPFDEQTCTFDFLSWTNPNSVLRIINPLGTINMDWYSESGEWEVMEIQSDVYQLAFDVDVYDHVILNVRLRRKWLFHALNIIAPVVCISLLNVLCFILPAESGERVTLCISVFLTLAVFLKIVTGSMPESSDEVAVFGIYVGLQLLGSAMTILMTVLSLFYFHKKVTDSIPAPFRLLTRLCRVKSEKQNEEGAGNIANLLPGLALASSAMLGKLKHSAASTSHDVTWEMVSIAVDRLCFVIGMIWHCVLFLCLIIEFNA